MAVPWAPRSDKTFFWSSPLLSRTILQKSQSAMGVQLNKNPARAIAWFVGVTIYCTVFNNNSPTPPPIFRQKKYC